VIGITKRPVSPEFVVDKVKTDGSGCVVTYIGLIRGYSRGKGVLFVEYEDVGRTAEGELRQIGNETRQKWQLDNIAIYHRIGKLKVGDINLVVAVASAHRKEGFAAF
jgi:molybdopterin synthase catalytic subunit